MEIKINGVNYEIEESFIHEIRKGSVIFNNDGSYFIDYEDRKQKEIEKVNNEFDTIVFNHISSLGYSQAERETFAIQEDEASYIDGKSKPSAKESVFIRALAKVKGQDYKELANKIKTKAEELKKFIASELAKKQLRIKEIEEKYASYK